MKKTIEQELFGAIKLHDYEGSEQETLTFELIIEGTALNTLPSVVYPKLNTKLYDHFTDKIEVVTEENKNHWVIPYEVESESCGVIGVNLKGIENISIANTEVYTKGDDCSIFYTIHTDVSNTDETAILELEDIIFEAIQEHVMLMDKKHKLAHTFKVTNVTLDEFRYF